MDNLKKGFLFTCLLALLAIVLFFGNILKNPNQIYFSSGGDGFKSYYGAMYHLNYDSTYFHFQGMNYPYGESIFFTDNQPLVTNSVKWFSNNVVDIRENIVAIINLFMVFSILVAALFLFLIFYHLGLSWWFGSLAAFGITLLSPQIMRMGGHFSLSHVFWLPLMLFLILKFDEKPRWRLSIIISMVVFLAASMHLYFAGFYGLLISFYWLFKIKWKNQRGKELAYSFLQWFVQIILPIILVEIIMISTDHVSDRTSHPYGFLVYLAHPVSVFLPSGSPYGFVQKFITVFRHLDWEAYAFIGVVALVGSLILFGRFIQKLFKGKLALKVSDQPVLNVFFWASIAALLLSFAIPFKLGLEFLVDYIGPFRQLRALARFAWLFYYVINLIVFYRLYSWSEKKGNRVLRIPVLVLALGVLFFDAYFNVRNTVVHLLNQKPLLEDKENELPDNQWIKQLDFSNYQVILPLPYFHVGSENIWIEPKNNVLETTLVTSLKAGLPITSVMMGRTSISQTYKNYSLVLEPLNKYEILDDFKTGKPILLLCMKNSILTEDEQRLIDVSTFKAENSFMTCYSLSIEKLARIPLNYKKQIIKDFNPDRFIFENQLYLTDSTSFLFYSGNNENLKPLVWNTLFRGEMTKAKMNDKYFVSFWVNDFRSDGVPRFNIEMIQGDGTGKTIDYFYSDIHRYLKAIDGNKALFEIPFILKKDDVALKISIRNKVLRSFDYRLSELLIRRKGTDLYQDTKKVLIKNTRRFKKKD